MCERSGVEADMCPYRMHCLKRCPTCGEADDAVCMNPLPAGGEGERLSGAEPPPPDGP